MTRPAWRIATDTRSYTADDLSGAGAKASGGRWNDVGVAMLYAAESRALACLETVVHLNAAGLPFNRYLVEIAIPDDLWAAAELVDPQAIDPGWDAQPAAMVSSVFGTKWAESRRSLILLVPSVIVPEERNILINPEHPDIARVTARKVRKWLYDPRFDRRRYPSEA